MRRQLVVGNWKMNGSIASNKVLLEGLCSQWQGDHQAEVAVCAPFVYLHQAGQLLAGSGIGLGAQDLNQHDNGAYTGEVAGPMLADCGCDYVIVGHSERRSYNGETDAVVAEKFVAAQRAGLTPILCVGETLEERDSGQALEVIKTQLSVVIEKAGRDSFIRAVVAYEPVWAIGTGRTATPEQAQEVHAFIREQLAEVGAGVRILYGGSVKPGNAAELFAQQDIDGALVGGASLQADDFCAICQAAE